jgi:hypothetical protein
MKLAKRLMAARGGPWGIAESLAAQIIHFGNAASLTVDSGLITAAADQSGNSRNASASGTARPTLYTDAYGRTWADFDGIDDFMTISVPQVLGSGIFVVVDTTDLQTGERALFDRSGLDGPPYPPNFYAGSGRGSYNYKPSIFWGYEYRASMTSAVQTKALLEFRIASGGCGLRLNGGTELTYSSGYSNVSTWTQINSNSTQRSKLKVGAYAILNYVYDTDMRQKVEGRLLHDFGLQSLLPNGHPYKTVAP